MKKNEYKCEHCKGVFKKGWSDEELEKEAEIIFGKHPKDWKDEKVLICDDCFTLMFPPMHPKELKEAKKHI